MKQNSPPPIGRLLKENNLVTEEHIQFALVEQKATGELMGECLMRLGLVTDTQLARVLAAQADIPFIDLSAFIPDREVLAMIPANMARQKQVLPLWQKEGKLHVAVPDPYDPSPGEAVFRYTGVAPVIHVGAATQLKKLIERFYYLLENPVDERINEVTAKLKANPSAEVDVDALTTHLLAEAISVRATDVHVSPSEISSRINFRIDGVMRLAHVLSSSIHPRLVSNIKVKSGMDISEKRKPQDGRMHFEFLGDEFDIRVSSVRSSSGENIVMRLLGAGSSAMVMGDIGFEGDQYRLIKNLLSKPNGIFLVTGPTGSGKTTTLYAALRAQDVIQKNIVTVEDPVEIEFSMIRQTQVNLQAGYTFASAVRTFLRQDPDVILVGEIRDEETAVMAVRAALTGHLVLSTLHANSATGALARLNDLGVSPYLMSTALVGVMAQRLFRKLCVRCREQYHPPQHEMDALNLPADGTYYRAAGCRDCGGTGYLGRTAVAEVLPVSESIKELISSDASVQEIESAAKKEGFYDLQEAGRKKVVDGVTSVEEFVRVLG
jgi:type IV pilus assembly protein PilB